MGSITSRPSVPSSPQIVYVPAPTPASSPSVSTPSTGAQNETPVSPSSDDEIITQARQQNLLQRSRGRFGTVLTGFRGVFTSSGEGNTRKTLLGE